ncbi:hypothetical protein ACKWTF_011713 [Chironomus riparius]
MINSEVSEHQPYYAYVEFANAQGSGYGGGVLISFQHVLTCAANIQGFQNWRIGLGSNSRRLHRLFLAARAIAHPNYQMQNNMRVFDIGIIFMNAPVEMTSNIAPIFMSPFPYLNSTNTQGLMLGYAGETSSGSQGLDNLQAAHVRILSDLECAQAYPNSDNLELFCGGDRTRRSNFCLGDQGGPFTVMSRGTEYLVGIASLPGCSNFASTYMPVISFREWIRSETGV